MNLARHARKIRLSQVLTLFYSRIPQKTFILECFITVSLRVYDSLFERKLHLLNEPSALCKLSFAFMNDKLQEAEENKQKLKKQVL